MSLAELIVVVALTFIGSLIGTDCARRITRRYGFVSPLRSDRWHRKPAAMHGGVGFFPSFVLGTAWAAYRLYGLDWFPDVRELPPEGLLLVALLLGAFVMFAIGLWDDIQPVRPASKLLFQVIAASLFILAGGILPLSGLFIADVLLTYLWFVGIINAVNMLDNMDGLAAGVVILASATLVVLTVTSEGLAAAPIAAIMGLLFIATLLGFLAFNYPPASIFMGDSGSLFIGFVLAALAIPSQLNEFLSIPQGSPLSAVLVLLIPATVLAVPIFDTTLVTITRKWRAGKASQGGRDHSSHRLVGLGLPEGATVWILYGLAAVGGFAAILLQRYPSQFLPLLALYVSILVLSGIYLGRVKVELKPASGTPAWTPLVTNLLFKKRFAEALLDLVLTIVCFYAAYLLRFDGRLSPESLAAVAHALPIVAPVCLSAFFIVGMYRGQWHLISVSDIPIFAIGAAAGASLSLAGVTLVTRFGPGHSRGAYIIFGMLLFLATAGARLSFRSIDALVVRYRGGLRGESAGQAVLIYGAGKAGKLLFEEITTNSELRAYRVVGFIDDDPWLIGQRLCGLPVRRSVTWARRSWVVPPEIWISSQQVSDESADAVAAEWRRPVRIRRLRLRLEPAIGDSTVHNVLDG